MNINILHHRKETVQFRLFQLKKSLKSNANRIKLSRENAKVCFVHHHVCNKQGFVGAA